MKLLFGFLLLGFAPFAAHPRDGNVDREPIGFAVRDLGQTAYRAVSAGGDSACRGQVVMIHWRLPYALIEWDNWQANLLADQVAAEIHQAALWQECALIAAAVAVFVGALPAMRGKPA